MPQRPVEAEQLVQRAQPGVRQPPVGEREPSQERVLVPQEQQERALQVVGERAQPRQGQPAQVPLGMLPLQPTP